VRPRRAEPSDQGRPRRGAERHLTSDVRCASQGLVQPDRRQTEVGEMISPRPAPIPDRG
jgi:hypothetical protein